MTNFQRLLSLLVSLIGIGAFGATSLPKLFNARLIEVQDRCTLSETCLLVVFNYNFPSSQVGSDTGQLMLNPDVPLIRVGDGPWLPFHGEGGRIDAPLFPESSNRNGVKFSPTFAEGDLRVVGQRDVGERLVRVEYSWNIYLKPLEVVLGTIDIPRLPETRLTSNPSATEYHWESVGLILPIQFQSGAGARLDTHRSASGEIFSSHIGVRQGPAADLFYYKDTEAKRQRDTAILEQRFGVKVSNLEGTFPLRGWNVGTQTNLYSIEFHDGIRSLPSYDALTLP